MVIEDHGPLSEPDSTKTRQYVVLVICNVQRIMLFCVFPLQMLFPHPNLMCRGQALLYQSIINQIITFRCVIITLGLWMYARMVKHLYYHTFINMTFFFCLNVWRLCQIIFYLFSLFVIFLDISVKGIM